MRVTLCMMLMVLLGLTFPVNADEPIGVFANTNTNSIQFINPLTQELSPSLLKGQLGTYGGGLFDVEITSDGKTAIVSNFGDKSVLLIDISGGFNGIPTVTGMIYVDFFAEDMVLTPGDKFLLVTDGGLSSRIAVVNLATHAVTWKSIGTKDAQAIAITPDGKTVFVADYLNGAVHSFDFDNTTGAISFKETQIVAPAWPVNLSVSPDGRTLIVATAFMYNVPVFAIDSNGFMYNYNLVTMPSKGGQSCVFSADSSRAYYYCNSENRPTEIAVLDITGPGAVTVNTSVPLSIKRGSGQFFGVDTIALDPSGNYLYITNPTSFGVVVEVSVVDLTTNTEVNQLKANGIPTGIKFGTIMQE